MDVQPLSVLCRTTDLASIPCGGKHPTCLKRHTAQCAVTTGVFLHTEPPAKSTFACGGTAGRTVPAPQLRSLQGCWGLHRLLSVKVTHLCCRRPARPARSGLLGFGVWMSSVQFSRSVMSDLCNPMNCGMPGLPVHHQLPEFTQTYVHQVSDAIQPSHPLLTPSSALSLSQHQGLMILYKF